MAAPVAGLPLNRPALDGVYSLGRTAGQPDAGLMSGGDYALAGGFWAGGAAAAPEYLIYLPLVVRDH